jgi:hypothetical protein
MIDDIEENTSAVIERAVVAAVAAVRGEAHARPTPETLLRRSAVAAALTASGYPVATTTLATMATRGGGPRFVTFGRVPLYRWDDALAWARGRTSSPRSSTSEPIKMTAA